jgi:hypothetical protein
MGKKQVAVTLRKPPQVDTDAFVSSAAETSAALITNGATDPARRANVDEIITRPDGKSFREMTIYLPAELARRLSLHCMEKDRDVSNIMAEMVKENLDGPPPPEPPPPPPLSLQAKIVEMGREKVMSLLRTLPWVH